MEEFTDIERMRLEDLTDVVLKNFGDRYAGEVTRILNTGIFLPNDIPMIQLALAITMGIYMQNIIESKFTEEVVIH